MECALYNPNSEKMGKSEMNVEGKPLGVGWHIGVSQADASCIEMYSEF